MRLQLDAGHPFHATVDQGDDDLRLQVAGGGFAAAFDGFDFGVEHIAFIPPSSGLYTFSVARSPDAQRRNYEFVVADGHGGEQWAAAAELSSLSKSEANHEKAIELDRQALAKWRELGDRSAELRTLIKIGGHFYSTSRDAEAREQFRAALLIASEIGDKRAAAEAQNDIGESSRRLGDPVTAKAAIEEALKLWRALGHRYGEAASAENLALLDWQAGEFRDAVSLHARAMPVFRALGKRRDLALAYNNLALVHGSLNEPGMALGELRRAYDILRTQPDSAVAEGRALVNIGYIELRLGRFSEAASSQQRALELLRKTSDVRATADALTNLGRARHRLKEAEQAVQLYGQALEIYRKIGDRRGEASALQHMGLARESMGALSDAERLFDNARQIRLDAGLPDSAADSLYALSRVQAAAARAQGPQLDQAWQSLSQALDLVESIRTRAPGVEFRASYFETKQPMYEAAIGLLARMGRDGEAFEIAERSRARSLLDLLFDGRDRIRADVDPALLARIRELEQQINMLAVRLNSAARVNSDVSQLSKLKTEIDTRLADRELIQDRMERDNPRYASLWRPHPASLPEVQSELDGETALLEFSLGEEQSFLWVIRRTGCKMVKLPGRTSIEALARRILHLAGNVKGRAGNAQAAAQLRQSISALRNELFRDTASEKVARRWIVVPDGVLNYIPMSALYPDQQITDLPSASMLPVLHRAAVGRKAPLPLIVFADPVFDAQDPRNSFTGPRPPDSAFAPPFDRLRFSADEARAIQKEVPDAVIAAGFEARKPLLMGPEMAKYRVVHLSTHALIDDAEPALSLIAFSRLNRQGQVQDGMLRLYETFNMDLSATSLVVLSACRTGLGKESRGEGINGFSRGFLYSGAKAVLVSLWAVDEEATEQMMPRFYDAHIREGKSASAALLEAQRFIRSQPRWSDPYYWAGFTVIGEQ